MKIGLLGGTFDPVHDGHLDLAQRALSELALQKIIFIPAFIPPHKESSSITSAVCRCEMLQLALEGKPQYEISDIEIQKQQKTYTVDTLREIKEIYPPDTEFFFLVGSDFLHEYHTWKEPEVVITLAQFVVAGRPGFPYASLPKRMIFLEGDFPSISSTAIRKTIKKGLDVTNMLPSSVYLYIKKYQLYQ
ncbi:MAG: nicotinate-nucleotide adenylyltransferase [Candidatus Omnitrophica bacterium]|nr:nicotinate-nucleotide adenylyltransferase [Candidatus Omnitrophota bacterium]